MYFFLFNVTDDDEWIYLSRDWLDQWIHRRLFHRHSCHLSHYPRWQNQLFKNRINICCLLFPNIIHSLFPKLIEHYSFVRDKFLEMFHYYWSVLVMDNNYCNSMECYSISRRRKKMKRAHEREIRIRTSSWLLNQRTASIHWFLISESVCKSWPALVQLLKEKPQ